MPFLVAFAGAYKDHFRRFRGQFRASLGIRLLQPLRLVQHNRMTCVPQGFSDKQRRLVLTLALFLSFCWRPIRARVTAVADRTRTNALASFHACAFGFSRCACRGVRVN